MYAVSVATPTDAVLPQSNGLFVLTNTTAVTLTGLTLSDATWLLDSDGFVQAQAGCIVKGPAGYEGGFDSWICMPGSIEVRRGRGCAFDNNVFTRLGAAGIALVYSDFDINTIHRLSLAYFGGAGLPPMPRCSGATRVAFVTLLDPSAAFSYLRLVI